MEEKAPKTKQNLFEPASQLRRIPRNDHRNAQLEILNEQSPFSGDGPARQLSWNKPQNKPAGPSTLRIRFKNPWRYPPSLPMASTGQPSMASLHCLCSSSPSGCLYTKE